MNNLCQKVLALALILNLASINAKAEIIQNKMALVDTYSATYEACSQMPTEKLLNGGLHWDKYNAGVLPSQSFNKILRDIAVDSMSDALSKYEYTSDSASLMVLLKDTDFLKALDRCYGTNEQAKNIFKEIIIKNDSKGKVLAGAIVLLVLRGTSYSMTKIYSLNKLLGHSVSTIFGSLLAYDIYSSNKMKEELHKKCQEMNPEKSTGECFANTVKILSENSTQNPASGFTESMGIEFIDMEIIELQKRIVQEANSKQKAIFERQLRLQKELRESLIQRQ